MAGDSFPQPDAKALAMPQGDDVVWRGQLVIWKDPKTWLSHLTAWLTPRFRADGWRRLRPGKFRNLCYDDCDWKDVLQRSLRADYDSVAESLADAFDRTLLRVYHGCRTADAGVYHRNGLRLHNRDGLRAEVFDLVESEPKLTWMRDHIDTFIEKTRNEIDQGCLFVIADDKHLIEYAAQYLIYGSEWIAAVVGSSGQKVLRSRGVPTMLEIDLPLSWTSFSYRQAFADALMREWTRRVCNEPDWSAPLDFTFTMKVELPPEFIVGHYHPSKMKDPWSEWGEYYSPMSHCPHCLPSNPIADA